VDVAGSAAGVIGLGGLTAGLIGLTDRGPGEVTVWLPLLVGVAGLAGLLVIERRARSPMVPPSLFRSRQFSAANAVTFLLYASISAALLLLVIGLQTVAGFTPLEAGTALLPITVVMLALASRAGAVAERIGPRIPMAVGPVICAVGLLLMLRLSTHSGYWLDVLPAVTVFGLGLAVFVAPLTATALGAVPSSRAGVASAVNNAVARAAGLIAIAALPALAGLTGDAYASPEGYLGPYRVAIAICAGLQVAGGVLAAVTIQNRQHRHDPDRVPSRSLALSGDSVVACSRAERDGADPPLVGA
jgi:hypothetical protein